MSVLGDILLIVGSIRCAERKNEQNWWMGGIDDMEDKVVKSVSNKGN